MKIRQKIAMLLAAAMTFTAMPMMTMAAADKAVSVGIQTAKKDEAVTSYLKLEMKDGTSQDFMFFVNIENAEFVETTSASIFATGTTAGFSNPGKLVVSTTAEGKQMTVRVNASAGALTNADKLVLPLVAKLKGGDATVSVNAAGSVVGPDMAPVVFARTSDAKATVTADDAKTIYTDATTVAAVYVQEAIRSTLNGNITLTVENPDYKFEKVYVSGQDGFTQAKADITASIDSTDKGKVVYNFGAIQNNLLAAGKLKFEFQLKSTVKKPEVGEIKVRVTGDEVTDTTVKVGDIKGYGITLEMKDKKVVDVVAGKKEKVTFTVKENVDKTMIGDRSFDVQLDKGFLSITKNATEQMILNDSNNSGFKIEVNDGSGTNYARLANITDVIKDKDDYVKGFTFSVPTGVTLDSKITEITVKDLTVYMPLGTEGDATVSVDGRALDGEASVVALNAKTPFEVSIDPMTVKVGLKEQEGGKITLKETDKGRLKAGEFVHIKLEQEGGLSFKTGDFKNSSKIKVTEGDAVLDLDASEVTSAGLLSIKVKRSSTVASTIEIANLTVKLDRTVPQGNYKFELGGKAVAEAWATEPTGNKNVWATTKGLEVKDFVIVATPNTEDISTDGLTKGTSSFVVGSSKFVVNGVEAEMDGTVYVANGRTMVPVRYVANALGVNGKNIYFANNTVTVIAGTKTVSLVLGDKVAKIAGVPVRTMTAAPVLKDGRVYVPVSEIGALLGVEAKWDAETQTATFINK